MSTDTPLSLDQLEHRFWQENRKASEIWRKIGPDLVKHGFTWAKYLRLLRMMLIEVILYTEGSSSLTLFIGAIMSEAQGPIGKAILEGR